MVDNLISDLYFGIGVCVCVFQRQLFGIEAPAAVDLTGCKKYFNSYTLQGLHNVHTHCGNPIPKCLLPHSKYHT